jgi:outer membrane protein TolC
VKRFKDTGFKLIFPALVLSLLYLSTVIFVSACFSSESAIVLSLEEAVAISLSRNRNIIRSKNDEESAILNLNSASSNFDIKLTPSAGVGISDQNNVLNTGITVSKKFYSGISLSGTPSFRKSDTGYNSRLAVSLDIPLLRFSGDLVNTEIIKSSEFSLRNTKRFSIQTKENIFLDTVTAFYNISELKKTVELNKFFVQRFENYSTIARTKTAIGLADPFDVYRSDIQAKDAQVSLSNSIERLQNARYDFKSLLAIPQDRMVRINDSKITVSKVNLPLVKAENIAFTNSIEIKTAEDNLNEKKRSSKIAKRLILPDLKLSIAYSREGNSEQFGGNLMDLREDTWGVYLVSTGDFGKKIEKNNYFQSRLNIKSAEIGLENIKDQLSKNVRGQIDTLNEAWDRIGLIKDKILDATGKLRLAAVKFDNGLTGNFDMIEAETELHQARLDLLRAKINYIKSTYRLRKIMGTLI